MQGSSKIIDHQPETQTPEIKPQIKPQIKIAGVELRLIRLPLVEPFETSFGKIDSRLIFLVCLEAEGLRGWGEVVAEEEPLYSYETVQTALHVIRDFLGPAVVASPISDLDDLVTFVRDGLHDPRVTAASLCALVPSVVPSGRLIPYFEGCR